MNWLIDHLYKEARNRRFNADDRVRYFTERRKGKGKGVVLTPSFSKGTVVDFNRDDRQYNVRNDKDEVIQVHPRNLIPDSISVTPRVQPIQNPEIGPEIGIITDPLV